MTCPAIASLGNHTIELLHNCMVAWCNVKLLVSSQTPSVAANFQMQYIAGQEHQGANKSKCQSKQEQNQVTLICCLHWAVDLYSCSLHMLLGAWCRIVHDCLQATASLHSSKALVGNGWCETSAASNGRSHHHKSRLLHLTHAAWHLAANTSLL